MPLINSIISWFNVKRLHQIELFKKYPGNVQREIFMKLIRQAEETEWGKKYHYNEIESINQFQARVPFKRMRILFLMLIASVQENKISSGHPK